MGSDAGKQKTTFETLYGGEGAMELACRINGNACGPCAQAYAKGGFLVQLAESLLYRRS